MTSIAVDKKGFLTELLSWQVPAEYAAAFVNKNAGNNGRIILHPFFFNDTEHLTNSRHWLAINAAFWCRAFREAEGVQNQIETLAGVRAIYYAAGALGVGEVKALIQEWWRITIPIHNVPAPSYSAVIKTPTFH